MGKRECIGIAVFAAFLFTGLLIFGDVHEETAWVVGPVELEMNALERELDTETNITTVKTFILQGAGTSMDPTLRAGEFYLCIQQHDYAIGDIVAYRGSPEAVRPAGQDQFQGYITGHRIINKGNGYFWVQGDNAVATDVVQEVDVFCRILV